MNILLIGNFAPPYEEENLYNFSLLRKLEEDGHTCSVINISETNARDKSFTNASQFFDFVMKLMKMARNKQVVHFNSKGYLRLGLMKLCMSVLIGKMFKAKTFVTIHAELFSIQGQMRSPVGGRQTLFTAFTNATRIISSDQDTYNTASMYMQKSNFDLIPSFLYAPKSLKGSPKAIEAMDKKDKLIIISNIGYPSLVYNILHELVTSYPLPENTGVVVSLADKPTAKLQHAIEEDGKDMLNNLIFIEPDDLETMLIAYSKADIVLRPLSCDGLTFFEEFALSVKKIQQAGEYVYFPSGLVFVKEGLAAELCVCIINTLLCVETGPAPEVEGESSYLKLKQLYEE
ncbi:MAG: glycosyltransferase [Nitrospira sp.]|nr:glycosyltransferase [bacterium]MBL7049343.1 glycosyltransferase [Nitrospira sp.]